MINNSNLIAGIAIASLTLFTAYAQASVITVKPDGTGHFTSIQQAYQAALTGDTILVYPGTYFENIHISNPSKNITIASLYLTTQNIAYIHNTIIDGNNNGCCIAVINTGQSVIKIIGFTIRNGSGHPSADPTTTVGGGIYLQNVANIELKRNIIRDNFAGVGGGIYNRASNLVLTGVTIKYNWAVLSGGGIFIVWGGTVVFDPILRSNIYLNHAGRVSDISKVGHPPLNVILDTFTVINPDQHFIFSSDSHRNPLNDITIDILNGKISPVNADLYVNPQTGCNNNSGLSPCDPLKTIWFAYKKIAPDSINPKSIFLAEGIYSLESNNEKLPVNSRSYVSLIGADRNNTIIDAASTMPLFESDIGVRNYTIENISFVNGANVGRLYAGIVIYNNKNVLLNNLILNNFVGGLDPGISISRSDNVVINELLVDSIFGGRAIKMGNTTSTHKSFRISNTILKNCGPHDFMVGDEGGGMVFVGTPTVNVYSGSLINVQITNVRRIPDPFWGPRTNSSLAVGFSVVLDVVNSTIAHNILQGIDGHAVGLVEGAEMNLYNSILRNPQYEIVLGGPNPSSLPVTANIAYSNIEGGASLIYNWHNMHTLNWLKGNINADPRWVGGQPFSYQLRWDSPCINAGTPMYVAGMQPPYIKVEDGKLVLYQTDGDTLHIPSTDLAGNPRITGGRIDMGAYEFQDPVGVYYHDESQQATVGRITVFPNPFTKHCFVKIHSKRPSRVVVKITDIIGSAIKTLMDADISAGQHKMIWEGNCDNGNIVPPGVYIVHVFRDNQR